jgi:hypothetical protein
VTHLEAGESLAVTTKTVQGRLKRALLTATERLHHLTSRSEAVASTTPCQSRICAVAVARGGGSVPTRYVPW